MPVGRPTKYEPEFCDELVKLMSDGYSMDACAGRMDTTRQTLWNWGNTYPEFKEALELGKSKAAAWWEDRLRAVAMGEDGNAAVVIFGVKNRARQDWRDIQTQEISGPDGGPLEVKRIERVIVDPASN